MAKTNGRSRKLPSMQMYPGDWLKDAGLRLCSPAARGVWIDMLMLMFECPQRGVFRMKNQKMGGHLSPVSLSEILNTVPGALPKHIDELLRKGVARIARKDGAIYSKRLVRDEHKRRHKAMAGSKGGQAKAKQTDSKPLARVLAKGGSSVSSSASTSSSPSTRSKSATEPEIENIELPERKNQATDCTEHLNNLIRLSTGPPLPSVTEEQVGVKLFGAGIPPEDVGAVSADDLKAAVKEWRDHQKEVRRKNPTGRAPNFGLGYLKNVLLAKRDKAWQKKKAQPAGPAAELVYFREADPRMHYWSSLSTALQKKHTRAMRTKYPELTTWNQWRDRWLTENEALWKPAQTREGRV